MAFSPTTFGAMALGSLFDYGWRTASDKLSQMGAWGSVVPTLRLKHHTEASIPGAQQLEVNLLGDQYGGSGSGFNVGAQTRLVTAELREKYRALSKEWETIFADLLRQVLPLDASFAKALQWLLSNGPYLGDVGRAQREQQISEFANGTDVFAQLQGVGYVMPTNAPAALQRVAVYGAEATAHAEGASMQISDRRLRARHMADGVEAVLAAWWRANDIVRDHLISRMNAQLHGIGGDNSSALTQLKLNNLADMSALRLEQEDIRLHSAKLRDTLGRINDNTRRDEAANTQARGKAEFDAQVYAQFVDAAAAQARAALNSNGLSVDASFSERRQIDME